MFNTNPWLAYSLTSNRIKSTYIQGFLDVCGNIILRNGGFSLPNGDVSMNGNLYVGLDASFNRNVLINGISTFRNDIYQLDGSYNVNISSDVGSFPNYGTTQNGNRLINIGSGNFKLSAAGLNDCIAIGNTIITASNPTGYGHIGIGETIFQSLTTGFQNIGIGNVIANSITIGHNNVFIGNGVATSTTSTGNTVAIGTAAGKTNTTGINNTYLGAFTDAITGTYNNSTALGFGTAITSSNQIKLGTISERVDISGNLNVYGAINSIITDPAKRTAVPFALGSSGTIPSNGTALSNPLVINGISSGTGDGATNATFNLGIFSFNGIGFVSTQNNTCQASIAVRTGVYTGVSFNATSDYRVKTNIESLSTNRYIVDNLKPVRYYNNILKANDIGFIAHEVQEQFPEIVYGEKDGENNQSINYNGLIAIAISEIKQLKQKVAGLEKKINGI